MLPLSGRLPVPAPVVVANTDWGLQQCAFFGPLVAVRGAALDPHQSATSGECAMAPILQDDSKPGVVLELLLSFARPALTRLRIAVAYTTLGGSRLLVPRFIRRVGKRHWSTIPKTLVTSVDYGCTDPEALDYWARQPKTEVYLVNADLLQRGHLQPTNAFHPKMYIFDFGKQQSYVIGSANLTRRGLTINDEILFISRNAASPLSQADWSTVLAKAALLDANLLRQYKTLRPGGRQHEVDNPPPVAVPARTVPVFHDEVDAKRLQPANYERFWVQAGSMATGGSRNILEVPRYANRFFGFHFTNYTGAHVVIGRPVLTCGQRTWRDRQLAWHGAPRMNHMERVTLPTKAQGGTSYVNTAVLFRRHAGGYELEVAKWNSSLAVAWRNASAAKGQVYRLGVRGPRMCGLL